MCKALKEESSNTRKGGNGQKIKKFPFLCERPNQGLENMPHSSSSKGNVLCFNDYIPTSIWRPRGTVKQ